MADEKTEGSGLNSTKLYQNSISSQFPPIYNFDFFTVTPKCLNCDTFSCHLFAILCQDFDLCDSMNYEHEVKDDIYCQYVNPDP
jgi:hypothetical protein